MEATRPRSVACTSLSERKRVASAGAFGWWRRRATDPAERAHLRRTGAVSCGVAIGSLLLVRVFAATAPPVLLALVFTVFVVVIICSQWRANEMDAGDPMPVRNRGITARLYGIDHSAAPLIVDQPQIRPVLLHGAGDRYAVVVGKVVDDQQFVRNLDHGFQQLHHDPKVDPFIANRKQNRKRDRFRFPRPRCIQRLGGSCFDLSLWSDHKQITSTKYRGVGGTSCCPRVLTPLHPCFIRASSNLSSLRTCSITLSRFLGPRKRIGMPT